MSEIEEAEEPDTNTRVYESNPKRVDDLTFAGEGKDLTEKMDTVENVRSYLDEELGKDVFNKCYPVLRDFGDKILFEEN